MFQRAQEIFKPGLVQNIKSYLKEKETEQKKIPLDELNQQIANEANIEVLEESLLLVKGKLSAFLEFELEHRSKNICLGVMYGGMGGAFFAGIVKATHPLLLVAATGIGGGVGAAFGDSAYATERESKFKSKQELKISLESIKTNLIQRIQVLAKQSAPLMYHGDDLGEVANHPTSELRRRA